MSTNSMSGLLIALSAGGNTNELAEWGLGCEHVEELMARMALTLLRSGHRLAFGGTLGNSGHRLTQYLIETAQSWVSEDSARECDVTLPATWPMVNYSAWPFHTSVTDEDRARLVGICQFVNVDPPGISEEELKPAVENWEKNSRAKLFVADALTAMRERSAHDADLRIVWGGNIKGALGWMAGVLEEVAFSLEQDKPVLVLGGFGGCSRLLADFLSKSRGVWPDRLSLAASADFGRDALQSKSQRSELANRFERIQKLMNEYRKKVHSDQPVNGVSSKLIKDALHVQNSRIAIRLVVDAAAACLKARQKLEGETKAAPSVRTQRSRSS